MTTQTIDTSTSAVDAIGTTIKTNLRQAALRRNLRTAAALGLAVSGGIFSTPWLAATAGGTFLAVTAWRYAQLRQACPSGYKKIQKIKFNAKRLTNSKTISKE